MADLRSLAHHEAAHAVLGHRLGFEIEEIRLGLSACGGRAPGQVIWQRPWPNTFHDERARIVLLAGPVAEQRVNPGLALRARSGNDLRSIEGALFERYHRDSVLAGYAFAQAERKTRALVADCWPAIERVARVLARRLWLSGNDLQRIAGSRTAWRNDRAGL